MPARDSAAGRTPGERAARARRAHGRVTSQREHALRELVSGGGRACADSEGGGRVWLENHRYAGELLIARTTLTRVIPV